MKATPLLHHAEPVRCCWQLKQPNPTTPRSPADWRRDAAALLWRVVRQLHPALHRRRLGGPFTPCSSRQLPWRIAADGQHRLVALQPSPRSRGCCWWRWARSTSTTARWSPAANGSGFGGWFIAVDHEDAARGGEVTDRSRTTRARRDVRADERSAARERARVARPVVAAAAGSVLDVGCGTAGWTRSDARACARGTVTGVDQRGCASNSRAGRRVPCASRSPARRTRRSLIALLDAACLSSKAY